MTWMYIRYLVCAICCSMDINLVICDEFWRSKAYHKIISFPRGNLSLCIILKQISTFGKLQTSHNIAKLENDFSILEKYAKVQHAWVLWCSAHVLFALFVFVCYSCIQHILCCVVLSFFVSYTICFQFLYIVHFDCPFCILYITFINIYLNYFFYLRYIHAL